MSGRKKLILDLDTGIDDALALAYALGSPEVELVGIIASYGNVTLHRAERNARAVLEALGHPEVPVFRGADRALSAEGEFAPSDFCAAAGGWCYSAPRDGMAFLARSVDAYGDDLLYVPTGPLTNLAMALVREPRLARVLPCVTFMGGALAVPGNVTPCAEANIHNDPEAADVALSLGLRLRMIGLDVTHQAILTRDDTASWRELGTTAGRLYADMTDHYIGTYEQNNPHMGGCALHDPLAVAAAIDPSLVDCLRTNLRVDLSGATRGRTVCDPRRLRDAEKNHEVALAVDVPRFLRLFRERVGRALAS